MEYPSENQQKDCINTRQAANEYALDFGFPVITKKGDNKEGDVNSNEYRDGTPPGIHPNEGRGLRQKDLHHGKECCVQDGKENPIGDPKDLSSGIFREQFA